MVLRYFTERNGANGVLAGNFFSTKVESHLLNEDDGPQNMTLQIEPPRRRKPKKATRFVKVELHFAEKWILLSEIRFHFEGESEGDDLEMEQETTTTKERPIM